MTRNWKPAPMTAADKAVYEVMADMPLKPGDMLLLGPESVRILSTEGAFKGSLPDKFVFQDFEWKGPRDKKLRRKSQPRK